MTNRIQAKQQHIPARVHYKNAWLLSWRFSSQITAAVLSSPMEPRVARNEDLLPRPGQGRLPGSRDSGPSQVFRRGAASKGP